MRVGKMRKNRFLVPINSEYDLYSMGKDGKTQMPLTAKASRDDVIFANAPVSAGCGHLLHPRLAIVHTDAARRGANAAGRTTFLIRGQYTYFRLAP